MITCKTCKHWRKIRDEDFKEWPGPHGECNKVNDFEFSTAWVSSAIFPIDPGIPVQNATTEPSLITQPDFGCILGESA